MPAEEASLLAQLSAELHELGDESHIVERVVARVVDVVPDAEHVSLTVRRRGGFLTLASTSALARQADDFQYALDEGPCVSAVDDAASYLSPDVAHDPRWPHWGPRAAGLGVGSLMSVPMSARGERVGALNMYSTRRGRFEDADTRELAVLYAMHVAYAVSSARVVSDLEVALDSRHVIGMAQGMLMTRYSLDPHRAFALLQRVSSNQNRKLRDVAAELVQTRGIAGSTIDALTETEPG